MAILACGVATAAGSPAGSVRGAVRLAGPAPARPPLEVFKHHEVCGDSVPDHLVIGPGGGVRYAVVWHESLGTVEQPLHVEADRATAVDVTYEPHAAAGEGSR